MSTRAAARRRARVTGSSGGRRPACGVVTSGTPKLAAYVILHFRSSILSPQRGHSRGGSITGSRRGEEEDFAMDPRLHSVMPEWSDQEFLRTVFEETRVIRTPLRGIIAGYHVLPYVLLGPAEYDRTSKTVEVRGRIRVSPRLVLGGNAPTYGEMFGERDLMDARIVARAFSFRYAGRVSLESEDLAIRRHEGDPGTQVERVLEELARREVIDTAVIASPDARFYPVSLDRFIREILDREFRDEPGGG